MPGKGRRLRRSCAFLVGSPYALDQTIDGRTNNEPGWNGAWRTQDGGANGGSGNALVKMSSALEGDGGLAFTVAPLGSTVFRRKLADARTDRFAVETAVNFGSVGDFQGQVIQDNFPNTADVGGPRWRITGPVGSRHFEVFDCTSDGNGTWENTGIAQKPGQWQDVAIDVNVVTQTWSFYVDGVAYNAPDPLGFENAPPQLNALVYFDTGAGSVDSIIVHGEPVPEPASLGLLAVGTGTLLLKRRRGS